MRSSIWTPLTEVKRSADSPQEVQTRPSVANGDGKRDLGKMVKKLAVQ